MIYRWIVDQSQKGDCPTISRLCQILGVSTSGYYDWRKRQKDPPVDKDSHLLSQIQQIVVEFPGYGYRRVTVELKRRGCPVNHKRVLRVMRQANLLVRPTRLKRKTTDSDHDYPVVANLAKGFVPTMINQLWVSDITYIGIKTGFVYLAVIIDLYSRRCIGWHLADNLSADLTIGALTMAVKSRWHSGLKRKTRAGLPARHFRQDQLIHHSDRGVQYACWDYSDRLKSLGIVQSMSRKGQPLDNPYAESFIKTLKTEEVYLYEYDDLYEAKRRIAQFIDEVYNHKRLHSSIGYLPPVEFEQNLLQGANNG